MLVIVWLLWAIEARWLVVVTLIPFLASIWLLVAFHLKDSLQRHFYSLANVIESLREGDYSMRVAAKSNDSAWSEVYREINLLAEGFQDRRLEQVEADILLDKLLAEFEIPAFIFDRNQILKNANAMGAALLAQPKNKLLGLHIDQLQLGQLLKHPPGEVVEHWFPERGGRWQLRKNYFIKQGKRFMLVLVNDLSRTLREEERTAWQRMIRVLGHELNNSLASVTSVSETLLSRLHADKDEKWYNSYQRALTLIQERSTSLLRFTESYTQLAKLPAPAKRPTDILSLTQSLCELVQGTFVLKQTVPLSIEVDPDQIQQLLINLMKNAVEASSADTPVEIDWQQYQQGVRIQIIDAGMGLPASDNLFVPFYTTKTQGSGIGLFLCRQIAEAHHGTLRLVNRTDTSGCIAEVWLPASAG